MEIKEEQRKKQMRKQDERTEKGIRDHLMMVCTPALMLTLCLIALLCQKISYIIVIIKRTVRKE